MRHPDPNTLVQYVMLSRTPDGKPCVIFRKNERNLSTRWGKEVPYCMADFLRTGKAPVLVFDNYIVPLALYVDGLEATQDWPIDTPHQHLGYTPGPHERVWTLLDKTMAGSLPAQDTLKLLQRHATVKTYDKAKQEMPDDKLEHVLTEVANRMGRTRALVRKILVEAQVELPVEHKPEKPKNVVKPHKFSTALSFKGHFSILTAIAQQCRVSVIQRRRKNTGEPEPCSFSLADLYDPTALGGYPIRCPVLGVELNWEESMSWFAPRVGRYDPKGFCVSDNIVIMSKLAKRITEGLAVRNLEGLLKQHPYAGTAFTAWASKHPVPSDQATRLLRNLPHHPLPPVPTIEEQREAQQAGFDRYHNQVGVINTPPAPTGPFKSVKEILSGNWDEED